MKWREEAVKPNFVFFEILPRACSSPPPTCPTPKKVKGNPLLAPLSLSPALIPRSKPKQILISTIYNLALFRFQEACVDWPGNLTIRYNDVFIRKYMLYSKFLSNTSFLD